jgi:hypothetical protein
VRRQGKTNGDFAKGTEWSKTITEANMTKQRFEVLNCEVCGKPAVTIFPDTLCAECERSVEAAVQAVHDMDEELL